MQAPTPNQRNHVIAKNRGEESKSQSKAWGPAGVNTVWKKSTSWLQPALSFPGTNGRNEI